MSRTYRRPNGTQKHATLNDLKEHFQWEVISENIVCTFAFMCVCEHSPDWHHPLEKVWLLLDPVDVCAYVWLFVCLRLCECVCMWVNVCECIGDITRLSCLFSSTPGWPGLIRCPDYPAWPATINPSETPGPLNSPILHTHTHKKNSTYVRSLYMYQGHSLLYIHVHNIKLYYCHFSLSLLC